MRDLNKIITLPEGQRGFYLCKENDYWLFGRPNNGVISWERASLNDFLNLGVDLRDIESVIPGGTYFCAVPIVSPKFLY